MALRERIRPIDPAPPLHVVAHDGEGDRGVGAALADGSDRQPHGPLEHGEGMFDARPYRRLPGIGSRGSPRHRLALGLLVMDGTCQR